jgi:hypothetical protein
MISHARQVSGAEGVKESNLQAMFRQVVLAGQPEPVALADLDRLVSRRVAADGLPFRAVHVDGAVCAVDGTGAAD